MKNGKTQAEPGCRRIAVVGAGISGLAAAFHLGELAAARAMPTEIVLFERNRRVGGTIQTIRRGGYVAETGPDSFLAQKPWALDLTKRLGLEDQLVGIRPEYRKAFIVRDGRLIQVPDGFALLAPLSIGAFLKSPLVSLPAKLRMAAEPLMPRRRAAGDESLASFVRRRMGRELLDRVVQPLVAGIYMADPQKLSLEATMPRFIDMERRYGSVIKGLRAARGKQDAKPQRSATVPAGAFLSFRNGATTLVDALSSRLGQVVRCGTEAISLCQQAPANRWLIGLADGSEFAADGVVCAAPAYAAARLVRHRSPDLAGLLETIGYASVATVNMAFDSGNFGRLPAAGYGFVVPAVEGRRIIAASFSSRKFPYRAPQGSMLIRTFIGGALQAGMMRMGDAEMTAAAREELRSLIGLNLTPSWVHVERSSDALPQYAVGHVQHIAKIRQTVSTIPGLALAGAAYEGVGMPDCIRSGEQAADAVFAQVASAC